MKKLQIIILALFSVVYLASCEKVEIQSEEPPVENIGDGHEDTGDQTDDGDQTDNGDKTDDDEATPSYDVVDVATFRNTPIYTQVWVKGYIVGAATGKNNRPKYEFGPEFTLDTAILLADDPDEGNLDNVISVCLKKGKRRDLLNLKDHPENRGMRVAVFGIQETYLRIPGIKTIDGLEFPAD